jgi:putative ABC transport system ATP-binding protein
MALIEVENLQKTYAEGDVATPALQGVTFSIEKGEFVAIMGPSGSGKSTLLHILGFLDRQSAGTYRFDGKQFDDHSSKELARARNEKMGFVFQTFNLLARATVYENVRLPLLYSDVPQSQWDARTRKAIADVGLAHRTDHACGKLSGGEKQRTAIARALVNNPQVIFADEPTGNLDSKSGKTIMGILQELNEKEEHTVILITHETYTAEHAARIIHILDGAIESDRKIERRRTSTEFQK